MKNFETEQKEFENVQKRTNHIALHPFFLAGEKFPAKQVENYPKKKTQETGRTISLFLLKIGNRG
ncbi:hypothetical protein [Chryseobacterium sp. c4a]|uniref:hypothetical protein n=1 Tax=Chryseobacterium sp. c4a TaxID=1573582 RepID=UPI0013576058|nr:hypothetical protein [Chryseobacterium sp. c4a]